ncbi:MAG: outer membrane beta-barrel protein [Bacteroides sp.]|nr:outer membrane beta-barrel protein [Bacteroides sp.]
MSKDINNGKGFLKDKMAAYQADPPPEVWESVAASLKGRGRGRKIIIILSAAASLALAITLGITWSGRDIQQDAELATSSNSEGELQKTEEAPQPVPGKDKLEERIVEVLAEMGPSDVEQREVALATVPDREEASSVDTAQQAGSEKEQEEQEEQAELASLAVLENLTDPLEEVLDDSAVADENQITQDLALDDDPAVGDELVMDINQAKDKNLKWVLGAMISPLYSFRDAQPDALAGTSDQESGTLSYAAGVSVAYKATRRLAIESGIVYNKMGISIGAPGIQVFSNSKDADFVPAGPESAGSRVMAVTNTVGNIVSNSGEIYVNNYLLNASSDYNSVDAPFSEALIANQGIQQHLDYLELPFNLRYSVLDRDFKIQVLGGLSTNFLVANYVTMEQGGVSKEIGYLSNIRNVNYSGNAGLGFVYHFLDQLSISLEPRFRYYLNSVNDATLPSTRPYTFGIYTGINYFF